MAKRLKNWTDEEIQDIIERFTKGEKLDAIGKTYGKSGETVRGVIRRFRAKSEEANPAVKKKAAAKKSADAKNPMKNPDETPEPKSEKKPIKKILAVKKKEATPAPTPAMYAAEPQTSRPRPRRKEPGHLYTHLALRRRPVQ